jgi:D-alanyl-D-alanine carboxypeptidase/D-alanyl-D-alanine-endopeptidase (penicillin-binding protein 4)
VDGSGLSRLNQVTPRQIVALLAGAWTRPWGRSFFLALPRAGRDGTLRGRFRDGPAEGRLRGKTGTLTRVAALAGYVPRTGRKPLAFAWLAQGFTAPSGQARADMDRFLAALAR